MDIGNNDLEIKYRRDKMLKSSVNADVRNEIGSNASNRIRHEGHVPGILYGPDIQPRTIEVDKKQIGRILRKYGTSVLLDIDVDGRTVISMIKDIQRHPVNNDILHIDFQTISYDKPISATVPIILMDRDKVENNEATIQNQIRELRVECLPQNIPESIEVSVKDLAFGHPLKIRDVEFSEDITILNEGEEVIASLTHVNRAIEEEEEVETQLNEIEKNDNITI